MKKVITLILSLAFMVPPATTLAAGYIGLSVGSTSPEDDEFDDSSGYKLTAGFNVNPALAIEASIVNLGEFDADDDLVAALEFVSGVALDGASVEVDGIEFAVVGQAPISNTASIFGRAGIFMWDADFVFDTVSFGTERDKDDGSDPFFGFGLSLDVAAAAALKFEYVAYEASDEDIDYLGAGLDIRF